jgi:hypothetical protein
MVQLFFGEKDDSIVMQMKDVLNRFEIELNV